MKSIKKDLPSSIAVFLVALPLCLGIALASGVPPISGLIAGIVGGLIVGALSGSHISVAGPAAGLVTVVLAALDELGSVEVFVVAVMLSGAFQLVLGFARAGGIAHYIPSSVIRGLLAAIGLILILKQIPHAFGYDVDAEGDFAFRQAEGENTFTGLLRLVDHFEVGAILIVLACFFTMWAWGRVERLRTSFVPVQLMVVIVGIVMNEVFSAMGLPLWLEESHRVSLPAFGSVGEFFSLLPKPDFSALSRVDVYVVALTIAAIGSLESLLNLEAADRLDPHKRVSPPNRELIAQGVGNIASGAFGGLPVTSVVVRSSVNAYSGAETRTSSILHGVWLLGAALLIPGLLGLVPLSALAAILIVIGGRLARPAIFREMWKKGWSQFLPFISTIVAILFTDLLIGVLLGLAVGLASVIRTLIATPFLMTSEETDEIGQPARLKLAQQVTFLHRARLIRALEAVKEGSSLVIDASAAEYIGPEVLEIITDFRDVQSKERGIVLSLVGFRDKYELKDQLRHVNVFTAERQAAVEPTSALEILRDGNERFVSGETLERDFHRQVSLTADNQHPFAAVLACIDSRVPTELLFDQGFGDIFSVRVAGNVLSTEIIASLEYATEVAGAHVIVVLGHTGCGAIASACRGVKLGHITELLEHIEPAVEQTRHAHPDTDGESSAFYEHVSRANVEHVRESLCERSEIIRERVERGALLVVGAIYLIDQGRVEFFQPHAEASTKPVPIEVDTLAS